MAIGAPRQTDPETQTLRAALLEGLRYWALSTGTPIAGMDEMVDHQIVALRRAGRRSAPAKPAAKQDQPKADDAPDDTDRPPYWWNRD